MKFLEKNTEMDYKKVLSIVVALMLVMVGYEAVKFKKESNFNKLEIIIDKNDSDRALLNKAEVLKIMRVYLGFDPAVANMEEVDFRGLEEELEKNPYIYEAEVFLNARHELKVYVTQRKPIARVKTTSLDFYVTSDGMKVPLSSYSTIRVPLITGYVDDYCQKTKESRVAFQQLVTVLNLCNDDTFLSALIEQVDMDRAGKLTFIPKIGNEKIVFGDLSDYEEKLSKLKKYYAWGKNQDGWNKYAYLNLEYKDQIALGK